MQTGGWNLTTAISAAEQHLPEGIRGGGSAREVARHSNDGHGTRQSDVSVTERAADDTERQTCGPYWRLLAPLVYAHYVQASRGKASFSPTGLCVKNSSKIICDFF